METAKKYLVILEEQDLIKVNLVLSKYSEVEIEGITINNNPLSSKDILNHVKIDYNFTCNNLIDNIFIAAMKRYAEYKNHKSKMNLEELESKLDETLGKETRETLTEWLKHQR